MGIKRPNKDEIFNAAAQFTRADERAAFVEQACGEDLALKAEIQDLLEHDSAKHSLQHQSTPRTGPTLDQPITQALGTTEEPGTQIGPYKLLRQIGEGGFGVVYVAEQSEPVERRVALKIIKPGMDTRQVIARFEVERQALAMMDHPNIAKVLDAGTTESGRPYFVMELVKGIPITKYCDQQHMTPKDRLDLFIPVCQGIQHAHQKGIIHRDLKPSNVLIAEYDDKPVPKVIDFGVAKATSQKLTEKTMFTNYGQIVGTLEYMSPEQADLNQLDIDTRSDIYSLGVLLYELLTGSTPCDRQRLRSAALEEMIQIIREEEPPKPSTRLSTIDTLTSVAANRNAEPQKLIAIVRGDLDWVVMKALEKDRARRYSTANGFANDVQRYLNDDAVLARPPSAGYQLRKFARRNKRALAAASLLGLALLVAVGTVAGSLGWVARDRAARQARVAQQVELILEDVERLETQQRWPEALAAVQRAETLVASGETDPVRAEKVRQVLAELELVQQLEEARLARSQMHEGSGGYDNAAGDRAYARAFAKAGLDVENSTVEAATAQLRTRPRILPELAAALTDWASSRRMLSNTDWQHLTAVADAVDSDPWRSRLRALWRQSGPWEPRIRELAATAPVEKLPLATLVLLATALPPGDGSELLRRAQQLHPGDFWLNFELAACLAKSQPEESVAYYRAALAIRPESTAVQNNLGVVLVKQGKVNEAIACYRKAIELDPNLAAAHSNLGASLQIQGKLEEAITCFFKAIELNPNRAGAHFNLGNALRAQNKPQEAIACYRKAIDARPTHAAAYSQWGLILADQGKREEAIACYRKAVELSPNDAKYHNNLGSALRVVGKLNEAIAYCRNAIEIDPNLAQAHFNLGLALEDQGKREEAINWYREGIELIPKSAQARLTLGNALVRQGELDEAIACWRKAVELDPRNAAAYENLGSYLHRQGKLEEAITHWRKAVATAPKSVRVRIGMGIALRDYGELEEAVACFREAIELDPTAAMPHNNLGAVLTDQGKLQEAIASCCKAIELDPNDAISHFNLGVCLKQDGRLEEAIARYRVAIELDPELAMAHENLGHAQMDQGKLEEAIASWHKVIELEPNSASAHYNVGVARKDQGNLEEAITSWRKAIELDPKHAGAHVNLAIAQMKLKRWDEARETLARLTKVSPTDSWAWLKLIDIDLLSGASGETAQALFAEADAALGTACWQVQFQYAAWTLWSNHPSEYEDICRAAAARFADSTEPKTLGLIARASALANEPVIETEQLVKMARREVEASPSARSRHILGLCLLRDHQEDAAIEQFHESLSQTWKGAPVNWLGLAIAHGVSGRASDAQEWLTKAQEWVKQNPLDLTSPLYPHDRIACQLLLREAEQLLERSERN